jgi:hypothetical protein
MNYCVKCTYNLNSEVHTWHFPSQIVFRDDEVKLNIVIIETNFNIL